MLELLIDIRDFAYIHYTKRYSKVSATNKWGGYFILFTLIFAAYYITLTSVILKVILKQTLVLDPIWKQSVLFKLLYGLVYFSPLFITCRLVLNRLEKSHPLYIKTASMDYSRKQINGWATLAIGWILLFLLA